MKEMHAYPNFVLKKSTNCFRTVLIDSVAMSESAMNRFARGGDTVIDTKLAMTRYCAIDIWFKLALKNFMIISGEISNF